MAGDLIVVSFRDKVPEGYKLINTTSRDTDHYGQGLSPFFLRNIPLYGGHVSKNMENAWQYSKVYECHVDDSGDPTEDYFAWARSGWGNWKAERYPMGKGAKPLYSYWDGKKLDYIEARKQLYFPMYAKAVKKSPVFQEIKDLLSSGINIALKDFDGYNHKELGMSFYDVINNPDKKCGHAFVIYGLLTGELVLHKDSTYMKLIA